MFCVSDTTMRISAISTFAVAVSFVITPRCSAQETQPATNSVDVCTAAAEAEAGKVISIRGTGWRSREGLVIGDRTCPLGRSSTTELPTMILIEGITFAAKADENLFEKIQLSRHGTSSEPLQVHALGEIQCRTPLQFQTSDDGDIVRGNGYGQYGLMKCRLVKTQIIRLRLLN